MDHDKFRFDMKKCAFFLLIALVGATFTSFKIKPKDTELKWYDWNEGYKLAAKKNKLVLVDIYTSWCSWCKRMDHDTYSDAGILNQINKDFIPVKFNPEEKNIVYKVDTNSLSGPQLLNLLTNYQPSGYPTIVVLYPKKNTVLLSQAGYQTAVQFKQTLANVVAAKDVKKDN